MTWTNAYAGTFTLTVVATDRNAATGSNSVAIPVKPNIATAQVNGNFSMLFYGSSNTPYRAECSANLTNWFTLTHFIEVAQPVWITDPANSSPRFYRVVENP